MSLKSQTREPQFKVRSGGLALRNFTSWKNPSTSAGFEPANLGSQGEHVTPRPPRPTKKYNSDDDDSNDDDAGWLVMKIVIVLMIIMVIMAEIEFK